MTTAKPKDAEVDEEKPKTGKGKGKDKSKGKAKRKGKGKADKENKGPSGPNLPRERITTDLVLGEVVEWKRKYGWIKPQDTVEHESADKHDGKIYVHIKDIQEGMEMEAGKQVMFHIFSDESGLGAEECIDA